MQWQIRGGITDLTDAQRSSFGFAPYCAHYYFFESVIALLDSEKFYDLEWGKAVFVMILNVMTIKEKNVQPDFIKM